jgi:hypothetical protein
VVWAGVQVELGRRGTNGVQFEVGFSVNWVWVV